MAKCKQINKSNLSLLMDVHNNYITMPKHFSRVKLFTLTVFIRKKNRELKVVLCIQLILFVEFVEKIKEI